MIVDPPLPPPTDEQSRYLVRLASRWSDRAHRAGIRVDRLRHLGEAWAILACPGADCGDARCEVLRKIVEALTPFELAVLADPATAGAWALELGYTEQRDGATVHTLLGQEIVAIVGSM